ncbi:hypothetical protein G6F68_018599 [Rhizopus microsporus]|nr:hypothetical protein G6F68_018599 [Rhizopus microsporus]
MSLTYRVRFFSCRAYTRRNSGGMHVQPLPDLEGCRTAAQEVRGAREADRHRQVRHVAALPGRVRAPAG